MPRLHQVSRAEASAPIVEAMYDYLFDARDPVAEPGTADGTTGDWWTVMANSPDALQHAVDGFLYYQSQIFTEAQLVDRPTAERPGGDSPLAGPAQANPAFSDLPAKPTNGMGLAERGT